MKKLSAVLLAGIILFVGCAGLSPREVVVPPDIDTYEGLAAALERGDDFILYDVRTPEEYESGHIPGALNVPHDTVDKNVPPSERNQVIVVYCRSGGRSSMAYSTLIDRNFNYVIDFGGIGNWKGELVTGSSPE